MISAVVAFGIAMAVAVMLTPIVRRLARDVGAVDEPGGRRLHRGAIPRLGGIAIAVAFFVPPLVTFGARTNAAGALLSDPLLIMGLTLGSLLLVGTGIIDDVRGVRAWHKLWAQLAAATIAFACGFRIDAVTMPYFGTLQMGVFAFPVTLIWITAIINAVNLIDGLDGLAGGVTFFACVVNFTVGVLHGDSNVMLLSASLGGAVLGFLLFNFNPATIFMGDSGSLFLGYVLATTSMLGAAVKSSTTVAILVPLIALGLPITDTLFAMLRRFLERRPIFSPDDGHIHHRLLRMGLTHRRAVMILYGLSIVFTTIAIVIATGREWEVGAALAVFTIVVFGLVRSVGNFQVAIRRWQRKERTWVHDHQQLLDAARHAVVALSAARSDEDVQRSIRALVTEGQFTAVELVSRRPGIRLQVPLSGRSEDFVEATYEMDIPEDEASLSLTWASPTGEVQIEVDVLLQLVADTLQTALTQLAAGRSGPRQERAHLRPV